MGATYPAGPVWLPYVMMAAFMGLAMLRGSRPRKLSVNRLWIMPTVLLAAAVLVFSQQAMPSPWMIAIHIVALALGALAGWWRGRLTHIEVDAESGEMTSRTSPIGMVFLGALVMLRYAARDLVTANAGTLHVDAIQIADVFLAFAIGLVSAQRLEMWLRARRMVETSEA